MNWRKKSKKDWGRLDLNSNKSSKWAISDFVEIIGGGTPKTSISEYWNGSIPWLSVKDFGNDDRYVFETEKTITNEGLNNSSTKLLQKDDIIISARGTVGELAMLPFPMAFNQSCYGIRPKDDSIDKTFLYYLLRNSVQLLRKNTHGSVFDTITRDTFKGIEVEVPSIEEQVKIAGILSSLDDKIAENKKINHHLEQIAKAIFYEKFGNQVPNGLLGDLASVSSGKRPPIKVSERTATEDIPILGAASIMGYTSKSLYSEKILVTGRVGTHGIIQRYNRPCWPSDNALVLKSDDYELVYQNLLSIDFSSMNRGSTQPLITQTDLKNVAIYIPTQIELSDFEDTVGTIMQQYESNIVANESLVQLRDSLLPKLMSGEISVTD
ncbi:restriction endonuclease subunit S [Streptococcus dysgalactiae]|uniref:Restriction endonuclease subunit S n=1 Tax=Streptococcus dysgalactiae TaxID=1334 RepID=A0AAE9UNN0_STRDY|nr:restriction endonuclease subunit S [Streptococcus dysgalactiae]WAI93759.1 restriction endonuclease subunit S [Streptococcus dysgalactiae]WCE86684.1 restriction endonuclease subunit S [Streptococcus dysgalactiae]WCN26679.1 restriction endonuclease subunit S [Streptococcus dysgalactiae]